MFNRILNSLYTSVQQMKGSVSLVPRPPLLFSLVFAKQKSSEKWGRPREHLPRE